MCFHLLIVCLLYSNKFILSFTPQSTRQIVLIPKIDNNTWDTLAEIFYLLIMNYFSNWTINFGNHDQMRDKMPDRIYLRPRSKEREPVWDLGKNDWTHSGLWLVSWSNPKRWLVDRIVTNCQLWSCVSMCPT